MRISHNNHHFDDLPHQMVSTRAANARRGATAGRNNNNNRNNQQPQDAQRPPQDNGEAALLPAIVDATPKGYSIDVRVFLAIITTTMALAFTAGVMIGPTNPALVSPILSLLGVPLPPLSGVGGGDGVAPNNSDRAAIGGGGRENTIDAPARKTKEGLTAAGGGVVGDPSSTSKKAREVLISADGTVIDADDDDEIIIKQPKRTRTDHVATLGYKIRESHVNIDEPVLEGTGDDIPREMRDVTYNTMEGKDKRDGPLLRDQSNPSGSICWWTLKM